VPSPYWAAVQRLFPDSVVRIKTEDFRSLDQAASPEEYLFWSVRARQPDGDFPERSGRVKHAAGILRARLGRSSQEAPLTILKKDLHAFFAGGSPWSPSRFESYGSCPYRFYTEYMLSLQPLESPQLGFDSLQQGSMVHEILEQVHRQAADPSDPKTVRSALPKVAAAVFELAPEKHGFRPSAFWEVEQQELLERVERSLDKLFGESQGWTPYRYECRFGFDPAPPLTIETPAGTIQLRGVIDRVDRAADGRLRIIDYKTGSSGLAKKDLLEGRRLQLPLYALAAQQALQLGDPSEAFYWSVNGANSYCRLSRFQSEHGNGIEAAIHLAVDYVARFLDGILNGRFSPTPPEGGCPSFCPAAAWCWRYSPGFSA
jgi:ATP-dependent helicase/DNAse subunit B